MNILHVLSQVFVSGPEFYVSAITQCHQKQGHGVTIISDTFSAPTTAAVLNAPIAQSDIPSRLSNIAFIRKVIIERKIDVVHAHSRAASRVCHWAVKGNDTPLVSTVHGRQHLHFSTRFNALYGTSVIAVCENIAAHLVSEVGMHKRRISVIPNGIDIKVTHRLPRPPQGKVLSIIGRVNGPKGAKTAAFIKTVAAALLKKYPDLVIRIAGGDCSKLPDKTELEISRLNEQFGNRIQTPGFVDALGAFLFDSSVVLCSGRVAIESLLLGVTTIALGEACCHGIVTKANFEAAAASNFGDILPNKKTDIIDFAAVRGEIESVFDGTHSCRPVIGLAQERYDCITIAKKIMDIYVRSRILKKHPHPIPVLMYHKIPDAMIPTSHRTFIPKKRFEQQLRFFISNGFTSITFADYENFGKGELPIKAFPKKPLLLTFDDGYESVALNALPLMIALGLKGVIFLLGDTSIKFNFWDSNQNALHDKLADSQQRQLFKKAGWEIGAHTMTHPDLTKLDKTQVAEEITLGKKALEREFGVPVRSFAYPYGFCNAHVKKLVEQAGFSFGISTDTGERLIEDDRFQIFRINIFPQDSFFQIWKKTTFWYRTYYEWKRKRR